MGEFLDPNDFPDIDDAETLIDDAESLAMLSAPCLRSGPGELKDYQYKAARAIMRGAVLRWSEAGNGSVQQQSAGIFSMTTTPQARRNSYWPSEKEDLQKICRDANAGKAYSISTAPVVGSVHDPTCSLNLGATFCSCGADIAGHPIFGQGS